MPYRRMLETVLSPFAHSERDRENSRVRWDEEEREKHGKVDNFLQEGGDDV